MKLNVKIFSFVAALAILFSSIATPAMAAPSPSAGEAPQAASCWSRFYNRGIWFEIVMDRCEAINMVTRWDGAWRVLKPVFEKMLGRATGSPTIAKIISAVLSGGFKARMDKYIKSNRPTVSLSSLWWNYPWPVLWAINY